MRLPSARPSKSWWKTIAMKSGIHWSPPDLGHCHGPAREIATDYSSAQAHFDVLILEAGIILLAVDQDGQYGYPASFE
jgi:hypothetical protein